MPVIRTLSPAALVLLAASPVLAQVAATASPRLGQEVVPTREEVRLEVDAGSTTYRGQVVIALDVRQPARAVRLHGRDLVLDAVLLDGGQGPRVGGHQATPDGLLTLSLEGELAPGAHTLQIDFHAPFGTRAVGLYRMEQEGLAYAFTQFEAADARAAFPCWDEPEFKIPFDLTLRVPEKHLALANTPVAEQSVAGGWRTVRFQRTPPLPSYLVALAAGPFDWIPIEGLGVPGRVVTPHGQSALGQTAAEITPPVLKALERYFGTPYPYAKLDLIAVPEFWAGAMENPGAITYAADALLLPPGRVGAAQRGRLVRYTAHELAHMWFGDLVTMRWWDDLWLNESFADWMGDKVTDEVAPELGTGLDQLDSINQAMLQDQLASSEAIQRPVQSPEDTMRTVGLTYDKGKSVLGMFEHWLGPETFRQGVRDYLAAHAWGNAEARDLYAALSRAAGRDLGPALAGFFAQPGVPLVEVVPLPGGQVRLTQSRLVDGGAPASALWAIPVTLAWSDGQATHRTPVLLEQRTQTVTLGNGHAPVWVLPNAGAQGYYRWSLPVADLRALPARKVMDARERIAFIGNLGALLGAGQLTGDAWLRLLEGFADDPEPQVVSALLSSLQQAHLAFVTPELEPAFAGYVRRVLRPSLARWGRERREGEGEQVTELRPRLLDWLGDEGRDPEVQAHATARVQKLLADPSSMDPDLDRVALALAARQGDAALFEAYLKRLGQEIAPGERTALLAALGHFEAPALRERALDYALGAVRPNELFTIPFQMSHTAAGRDRIFRWTSENFDRISRILPPPYLAFLPFSAGGCELDRLEKGQAFFAQPGHQVDGTREEMAKVTDQVKACVRLRSREGAAVAGFLAAPAGAAGGAGTP